MSRALPELLLVADLSRHRPERLADGIGLAVEAGARFVQWRDRAPTPKAVGILEGLVEAHRDRVVFTVNGDRELAGELGVGLHLPASAREIVQQRPRPLGRSVHTVGELERIADESPDYLIVGNVFETRSKPGRGGAGVGALARLVQAAAGIPCFGIGGIGPAQVAPVLATGARGIAVCDAVFASASPAEATAELLQLILEARAPRANRD